MPGVCVSETGQIDADITERQATCREILGSGPKQLPPAFPMLPEPKDRHRKERGASCR
jgi:hypothetical protein